MKLKPFFAAALVLSCIAQRTVVAQPAPQPALSVSKTEPPNWWTGLPAPTLLLYGAGLEHVHASLARAPQGVSIASQKPGKDGLYYFVTLAGTEHAQPGELVLQLKTLGELRDVRFNLLPRSQSPKPQPLTGNDVIYLIMPDRFADGDPSNNEPSALLHTYDRSAAHAYHGGDLKGIEDHLPYLKSLGVTVLWLTPIVKNDSASPQDYHGYGAVDLYRVDDHFGNMRELQELVESARGQGIRIFLDFVPNHVGPRHPWAQHPPADCWLHGTPQHHAAFSDDFRAIMDPHATAAQRRDTIEGWFAGVLPDLDNDCPDVERYWTQYAIWWIESSGAGGFRIDTFPYSSRKFWARWHSDIRQVYPELPDVGEVINSQTDDPEVTSFFQGGRRQWDGTDTQLTTLFDVPMRTAVLNVLLKGAPAFKVSDVLARDYLYPHPEILVTYFGNHDVKRFMSQPGATMEKLKLAYGLLATLRGIPQIYAGDELGMQGGNDPDNRRDFPGGFPGDPRNAFLAVQRTPEEREIFDYASAVLALRHLHPALQHGDMTHAFISDKVYAFTRTDQNERLLVLFNPTSQEQTATLTNDEQSALPNASKLTRLSPATGPPVRFTDGRGQLTVPPQGLEVYKVEK